MTEEERSEGDIDKGLEEFKPKKGLILRLPNPWIGLLCDRHIDIRKAAGSDLQGIGASDSTKQTGNTIDVSFVDGRKRSRGSSEYVHCVCNT